MGFKILINMNFNSQLGEHSKAYYHGYDTYQDTSSGDYGYGLTRTGKQGLQGTQRNISPASIIQEITENKNKNEINKKF